MPAPGEPGSETWPKTAQWKFGGGALWLAGVADEEAGLVYYVTGNGVPQLSGEHREGDNLYLCSVVALDMKTGKLKWHYQTIRHDIWEADMSISPVLYDAQVDGKTVKAIGAIRPDGYVFTFDRITGKPLMKIEDRKVPQDRFQKTAATQPFPVGAEARAPGLRLVAEDPDDAEGLRGGLLLPGRLARQAERADAVLRHARRADVLQPADRLLLRRGRALAALAAPRRGRLLLQHRLQQQGARHRQVRDVRHGGDRRQDAQDRLAPGVPARRRAGRAAC